MQMGHGTVTATVFTVFGSTELFGGWPAGSEEVFLSEAGSVKSYTQAPLTIFW